MMLLKEFALMVLFVFFLILVGIQGIHAQELSELKVYDETSFSENQDWLIDNKAEEMII